MCPESIIKSQGKPSSIAISYAIWSLLKEAFKQTFVPIPSCWYSLAS